MTSLADRAAQMSPKAREVLARELVRAGTAFPTDIAEPIAVIGMGCRLPGNVHGPEDFWQLLLDGRDTIGEVPADRWDADAYYDPDPEASGKMTTKWGGFVDDVAGFDADFFGITPREAAAMDPQQRMLLEVSWEALEHAGVRPDSLTGTRTAAIMGLSTWDYTIVNIERRAEIDAYVSTGNPHAAAVGRIAYLLGFRGPAVAVDTACSSSLVAVHLACQSLRLRESDVALAGGVQLALSPFAAIAVSKWSALSPTGRCKTFDAGADGFVRGEGCGVLVLKRLSDATKDRDRVLAVIRGSAINQDGRSNGLTAPNLLAQREVINTALKQADVKADSVNYVETHGTGTMLGDPIEFEGLAATYGRGEGRCALGAVKTNLGHLEAAAGVAGLIKAILAVGHGYIPRNLNFNRWNPAIDASATRLFVPTEGTPWPGSGPRRAAVSSFGLSGTNSHVVIEQAPDAPNTIAPQPDPAVVTLVVSGKSAQRLAATAGVLADWMQASGDKAALADVARTLSNHRARYATRGIVVARDRAEAATGLRALAAGKPAAGVAIPPEGPPGPGTVFVYSGRGSQWAGMGRQLLADEPAFAKAIAELEPDFVAQAGFSLHDVIASGKELEGIEQIQLGLIGMQLALTALWRSYGVRPDLVIGHSMGEVAAAVVAGALTPAEGLRVTATRARLMAPLAGKGGMALLELDAATTESLIADYPQVTLGIYNSPQQTVISGPTEQVDELIERVRFQDRFASRVNIEVAPHNPAMDALQPEMLAQLADLTPRPPTIPIISTTFEDLNTRPVFDAEHWATNMRNPVRFQQAITSAGSEAHQHTFIEISAHPLLTHAIAETLGDEAKYTSLGTLQRGTDDTLTFHTNLALLGHTPPTNVSSGGGLADIPTTPWQHVQFWVEGRSVAELLAVDTHPLLGVHVEVPFSQDHVWQADVGTDVSPWMGDHKVFGQPALPAAAYAEIALAAACEALHLPPEAVSVNQLEVEQMLTLDDHTQLTTQLMRNADNTIRIEISTRTSGGWTRHAVAKAEAAAPGDEPPTLTSSQTEVSVSPADLYAVLRQAGQHHGPAFAALTRIDRLADGSVETEITLPDEAPKHSGYRLHPAMLDAALQSLAAAMPADGRAGSAGSAGSSEASYLPVSFESLRLFGNPGRYARCRAKLSSLDEGGTGKIGRVVLTDAAGNVTAEINDIYLRSVERRSVPLPLTQKVFEAAWVEQELPVEPETTHTPGSWLVLGPHPLADEFVSDWASDERRVITADLADESGMLAAFADTAGDPECPPAGVVVFVPDVSSETEAGVTQARDVVWSIATVVRAVVGGWHGSPPRVWLVTKGGFALDANEPGQPAVGALKGLVRVLAYEHPELRATLVDLDRTQDLAVTALRAELEAPETVPLSTVIARRGERRYVQRLLRATGVVAQSQSVVRSGAAYIISGGLGGLGLVVARWLVDNGAGRVVLNGRSEPAEEQRKALAELEGRADIVIVRGDLASPGVAEKLVAAAENGDRPLRGILHAAAVIDDSLLYSMTRESLERVWAPKAVGALRLHEASAGRELDWWMGFSSTASLLGAPGQGAYACANAWLDAFVDTRRASGLPAAVINWGPWSEVGMARTLANSVLDPITPAEGIEAMESLLASERRQTGVARLRPDRALIAFPEIRNDDFFAAVVQELDAAGGGDDWAGPDALRDLDPAEAARVMTDQLRARIAAVMGYADRTAVDPALPLLDLGMDSLMAVRIRNTTRADFGAEPPVTLLLQGASLQDVTTDLMRQLGISGPEQAQQAQENADVVRDRAQQRAAARRGAATRRRPRSDLQGG